MNFQDFDAYEKKWTNFWEKEQTYKTPEITWGMKKKYILDMFPYPSGVGLHVGHPMGYIATDILARFYRMKGYAVLHPMGWDAFGLPAENYAIKTGIHPSITTRENVENMKAQLIKMGFSYDWEREINTTDPKYYKWTQWIFTEIFKKGLAYEALMPINWCPKDKTGLANEEVNSDGTCDRCGTKVEQKPLRQWVLKITDYAERLLADLDDLDWPENIKEMQRNWIGKSIGTTFSMAAFFEGETRIDGTIDVFTTRIDTAFGMSFVAIAPEHPLLEKLVIKGVTKEVEAYIDHAKKKTSLERSELSKEKTGIFTGSYAQNPFTDELVPIYVCDYVLGFYGTGAVMGVPSHDERDFVFAQTFGLPLKEVVTPKDGGSYDPLMPFTDDGVLADSGKFSGMTSNEARSAMTEWIESKGQGEKTINYKLRDWVFSRQRYWGEPIPIVHTKNGNVALELSNLPLTLPEMEKFEPSGTGESPLSTIAEWVNTPDGKRETNTMPQWAGSSWYYLRYIDPNNDEMLADHEKLKAWLPVDIYVGGVEHAVLHLLYARFWHKVLYDIGAVPTKEPFQMLKNQGLILAEDNSKMSKSKGNVISPDDIIEKYGADTLRTYEMFMGPFEASKPWSTTAISGVHRFLMKVWGLFEKVDDKSATSEENQILHQTIEKITNDIENFGFNTSVSTMMICVNTLSDMKQISRETYTKLLQLLAPFAPFITEELWNMCGMKGSIHLSTFPEFNASLAQVTSIVIAVQVNGKVRGEFTAEKGITKEEALKLAKKVEGVAKHLEDKKIVKEIYVPGKLVSLVVE